MTQSPLLAPLPSERAPLWHAHPEQTGPERAGPEQAHPEHTRSEHACPEHACPEHTRSEQARYGQAPPEQARSSPEGKDTRAESAAVSYLVPYPGPDIGPDIGPDLWPKLSPELGPDPHRGPKPDPEASAVAQQDVQPVSQPAAVGPSLAPSPAAFADAPLFGAAAAPPLPSFQPAFNPVIPPPLAEMQTRLEQTYFARLTHEAELLFWRRSQPVLISWRRPSWPLRALSRLVPRFGLWLAERQLPHSGLFDSAWYLSRYPDVPHRPARHYLRHGGFERRDPSPWFSSGHYLDLYPDIVKARCNPLLHYLNAGRSEGRAIRPGMAETLTHSQRRPAP